MKLTRDRIVTPMGTFVIVTDDTHLRGLHFDDDDRRLRRDLRAHYGPNVELADGRERIGVRAALEAYFAGDLEAIDAIPVATNGTEFQRSVWNALRDIRPGTTLSYGDLARKLGNPGGSRAVGIANGSNPIALVVPCHRVIGADGSMTGYGGGVPRKIWLLKHEGALLM